MLDKPEATPMSGTEGGSDAFFSPDGQWIGFFAGGKLKKVAVHGGAPVTLCDAAAPKGGSWGNDGNIIFMPDNSGPLMRVSSAGGTPQPLTKTASSAPLDPFRRWPQVLPGGKAALFTESINCRDCRRNRAHDDCAAARNVQPVESGDDAMGV